MKSIGTSARSEGATVIDLCAAREHRAAFLAHAFDSVPAESVAHGELDDTLRDLLAHLDLPTALSALRELVGIVCLRTGATPRSLLAEEFVSAPSDEWWRAGFETDA